MGLDFGQPDGLARWAGQKPDGVNGAGPNLMVMGLDLRQPDGTARRASQK